MSMRMLATGHLIAAPAQSEGPSGKLYVRARMATHQQDGQSLAITLFAFGEEARSALMALGQGAELCASGMARVGTWADREGRTFPSVTLTVASVLTLHETRKVDKAVARARQQANERRSASASQRALREARQQWRGPGDDLDVTRTLDF